MAEKQPIVCCNKRLCFVFAWLLMCLPLLAQETGAINGYVKDAKSGETLIMANVFLEGTGIGTTTNNSGYFTLTGIQPGKYQLVASYLGFADFRSEINLKKADKRRVDIELQPIAVAGRAVTVEAEYSIEEEKAVGVAEMKPAMVQQ